MRVKITYTVDSEKVLKEVEKIIRAKVETIRPLLQEMGHHDFETSPIKFSLGAIDSLRRELFDLDSSLMDVDGILRSYAETNFPKEEKAGE